MFSRSATRFAWKNMLKTKELNMDRRNFLKGSSAALGLGATTLAAVTSAKAADDAQALAAPAVIPKRRTLRMLSLWPDAVSGFGDHVRRYAKRIEAATDSRWVIDIAEEPVTGAQAFKAVMTGDADLYVGHEHAHRELHPAFSYFAGLPCRTGMEIDRMNAWLMAAGGQELWDELAAEFNMKGLVIGHSGPAQGVCTLHPIPLREHFHGKRIAVMGLGAEVLKAVDAVPIERTMPTLATLIEDQSLFGVELIGSHIEMNPRRAPGFYLNKAFWMNRSLNDSGYAITLGLRRSLWDGFVNSERILLSGLASEALAASQADDRVQEVFRQQTTHSKARPFASPTEPTPHERIANELTRIAETIVADLSGHDGHARRINASYMGFKAPRATQVTA